MNLTIQKYVRLNNPDQDLSIEESDGGLEQVVQVNNMELHRYNVGEPMVATLYTDPLPDGTIWSVVLDKEAFEKLKNLT